MEYNKQEFAKSADRKKLHKVKKQWVVISTALLMALGGGALATHVSAHADTTNNNQGHNVNSLSNSLNKSAAPQLSVKSSAAQSKASNSSNQPSSIMDQAKSLHSQILKSGLQHSNQMKSITSNGSSAEQRSSRSSASVSTSSANHSTSASSSVSQLKSGSTNAVREVVKSANNLTASNTNTSNAMILRYFNQHGSQVGNTDTIPGQKTGTSIDVSNPSQGGEVIPRGYKLDPGMSTTQTFTDRNQAINLELSGDQITSDNDDSKNKVVVYISKNSSDGSTNNRVSDYVKGRVGDTETVDPGNYLPNGYYANSDDHTVNVTIQPDGSLVGPKNWNNTVNFGYTKDDTQLKALNKIYMHYVDRYHEQNGDIPGSTLSDADMTGTPFTSDQLKQFENLAPKDYYSLMEVLPGQQVPTKFEGHTQSITFLVAKDDDINYVNQSDGSVLKTISLNPTETPNDDVSYNKYSQAQYVPSGYTVVGPKGNWNSKFTSGGVNTILVRRNNQYGKITIDYVDEDKNDQIVGHASDTQKVGTPFNDSSYTTANDINQYTNTNSKSSTGYKYDRILNYVSSYGQNPQTVKIGVKETHYTSPSDNNGIVKVIYKDASDQQEVGHPQTIKGIVGTPMKTYYDAFSSQNEINENVGKGYILAKDPNTDPNNDQKLEDEDTDTIWVKKAAKPVVKSKITVNYVYKNGLVGYSSISDNSGTAFNPTQYAEDHVPDPSKYSFDKIISGAGISQFTNQPQQIIAAVNLKHAPVTRGTVNIHFMYNGNQLGNTVKVTSDVGHAFNINNYENTQHGMPSGYKVNHVNPTITQIPKGNTDEDVYLDKIVNKGTVNIHFMYNGNQLGNTVKVTSDVGHAFNINNYENTQHGMPNGYSVASVNPIINQIPNGTTDEDVILNKNKTPVTNGTIGIHYFINGNSASNYYANGAVGSKFNINNYLNTADGMPSGYSVINYTPNNITKFTNQLQNIDVNLKKNANPKPQPIAKGTINVYFKDNGNIYGPHSVTSNVGDSFNIADYENVVDGMPINTHVVNVEGNTNKFTSNTQNVYVDVAGNTAPVQPTTNGTISIYFDDDGHNYGPHIITGKVGDPFNISNYENAASGMPSNTHVVSVYGNVNAFINGNQNIFVNLADNNTNTKAKIYVVYRDANDDRPLKVVSDVGNAGSLINYNKYTSQIPSLLPGYRLAYVGTNNDSVFKNGGMESIYVSQNSNSNTPTTPTTPSNHGSNNSSSSNVPNTPNTPNSNSNHSHSSNTPASNSNTPTTPGEHGDNHHSNTPSSNGMPTTPGEHGDNHHSNTPSSNGNGNGQLNSGNNTQSTPSNFGDNNYGNVNNNRNYSDNTNNTADSLPQTGNVSNSRNKQVAEIMGMLGMALSALGYAIDRKRRDY